MARSARLREVLAGRLVDYERVVEVGIGRRTGVAGTLADRGVAVTATDVHDRPVPDGVRFVRDDVVDPEPSVYADADAIYALNLPPELHRPTVDVARSADADCLFTTLGADWPQVPVERESLTPAGSGPSETLFVAIGADQGPQ